MSAAIRCKNTDFAWGKRTFIMGICNLSPDSFSGDGLGSNTDAVVAQAKRFVAEGADIIDIGGESTRPGTQSLAAGDANNEIALVIPAIEILSAELNVPISIDTYKASVAEHALRAGASMINDIWGLKRDGKLAGAAAAAGVPVVLMSNQRDNPCDGDIMAEIIADLTESINLAIKAGISPENLIVDPGIGFGKTLGQNLDIMRRLSELKTLGKPVLLGTSRKSMIGLTLDLPADQRLEGTAATVAIGIANGADIVRVHDVKEMARVCRMSDAIVRRSLIDD
ncbi:dihydropteroate synthase [Chloroflexota bacterium]